SRSSREGSRTRCVHTRRASRRPCGARRRARPRPRSADMRPAAGRPLGARGRAERFVTDGGELWVLPGADAALVDRLAELGERGVGGFVHAGRDDGGAWAVRRVPTRTLDTLARGERIDPVHAVPLVESLAKALEACESRAV